MEEKIKNLEARLAVTNQLFLKATDESVSAAAAAMVLQQDLTAAKELIETLSKQIAELSKPEAPVGE